MQDLAGEDVRQGAPNRLMVAAVAAAAVAVATSRRLLGWLRSSWRDGEAQG